MARWPSRRSSSVERSLADAWRRIIVGEGKSWVAFEHGTCVILIEPEHDLTAHATRLLAEWGPVQAGTPSGDFSVIPLANDPGFVVTCHHPDILAYVSPEEVGDEPSEVAVGLLGREKRDRDAHELRVIHVEDRPA